MLERGYARTSLAEVAEAAGVSARTVYVRFASKAALLTRMIDVAVVGDVDQVPLHERAWVRDAFAAPTLEARVEAFSTGVAQMQARLAPLVALAVEVEASEPLVATQAAKARAGNHEMLLGFWSGLVRDGLVAADLDVARVAQTTMLLSASETAVLRQRTFGEETEAAYAAWLRTALMTHTTAPTP